MGGQPTAAVEVRRLRKLVAASLGVAPEMLARDVPLSRYGLDSLGAVELTARIEDRFGQAMPEWLDLGDATLDGLGQLLLRPALRVHGAGQAQPAADAVLPESIRP